MFPSDATRKRKWLGVRRPALLDTGYFQLCLIFSSAVYDRVETDRAND